MIRLEHYDLEREVMDKRLHIALPFDITIYENEKDPDKRIDILVYSFCTKIAEEFLCRFADDPLGEEASHWLREQIDPLMEGYETAETDCHYLEYRAYDLPMRDTAPAVCTMTLTEEDYKNAEPSIELDAFEIEADNPDDGMALVRDGDRIVAFAAVNDVQEDALIEINVECAPEYRRRGYGLACTACLTRHFNEMGKGVKYICDTDNLPSLCLAEKAGFDRYSTRFPLVYYRIEPPSADGAEEEVPYGI